MFYGCNASYLDLSSFNTSNVINMHGMFIRCKAKYINLKSFKTSKVKDMDNMFTDCEIETICISKSSLKNLVDTIYTCDAKIVYE